MNPTFWATYGQSISTLAGFAIVAFANYKVLAYRMVQSEERVKKNELENRDWQVNHDREARQRDVQIGQLAAVAARLEGIQSASTAQMNLLTTLVTQRNRNND